MPNVPELAFSHKHPMPIAGHGDQTHIVCARCRVPLLGVRSWPVECEYLALGCGRCHALTVFSDPPTDARP
jgi:hypothetical protein